MLFSFFPLLLQFPYFCVVCARFRAFFIVICIVCNNNKVKIQENFALFYAKYLINIIKAPVGKKRFNTMYKCKITRFILRKKEEKIQCNNNAIEHSRRKNVKADFYSLLSYKTRHSDMQSGTHKQHIATLQRKEVL